MVDVEDKTGLQSCINEVQKGRKGTRWSGGDKEHDVALEMALTSYGEEVSNRERKCKDESDGTCLPDGVSPV